MLHPRILKVLLATAKNRPIVCSAALAADLLLNSRFHYGQAQLLSSSHFRSLKQVPMLPRCPDSYFTMFDTFLGWGIL